MLMIALNKKNLLHQVRELIIDPKRLSLSGEGIVAINPVWFDILSAEEIAESKEFVRLLVGSDFKMVSSPDFDFQRIKSIGEADFTKCRK